MTKKHLIIVRIAVIALFSALCYVGTLLSFPIPSPVGKPMIHFGNFFVLLASCVFGPVVGASSGAIGMGLYDITHGYGIWTLKTICLKMGIGLVCGLVFMILVKKKSKRVNVMLYGASSVMLFIGLFTLCLALFNNGVINVGGKDVVLSWPLYTFSLIIGIFLLVCAIFNHKLELRNQYVVFAGTCAVIFNIFGEMFFKILKTMIAGNTFIQSFYLSVASIPSTIINGTISLTILVFVYPVVINSLKYLSNNHTINEKN